MQDVTRTGHTDPATSRPPLRRRAPESSPPSPAGPYSAPDRRAFRLSAGVDTALAGRERWNASMTGRLRFLSGWIGALLLAGFPAQVGHSQTLPEQLSADTVMSFIEANDIGSAADLIESLPRLHKRHVAFVFDSEAIQPELVSREHPRVVSWGADARFILPWASNPDAPDLVEFLEQGTTQWDAGVIDFSGDEAELSNPEVCSTCHGHLNKPIWGKYDLWLGTDGSRDLWGRDVYSPLSRSNNPKLTPLAWTHFDLMRMSPAISTATGKQAHFSGSSLADEFSAMLSVRHAEVLFNRLKQRGDYTKVARTVICTHPAETPTYPGTPFSVEEDNIAVMHDDGRLKMVQQRSETVRPGVNYRSRYASIGHSLRLLLLHDAWSRDTRVSDLYSLVANEEVPAFYFRIENC